MSLGKKSVFKSTIYSFLTSYSNWFEPLELVYFSKSQSWHSPESCIWAEERIQLPNKISLATEYKSLKTFFTRVLGVQEPNLEMHIQALTLKASQNPKQKEIVQEMMNICAFNPKADYVREKLADCKCFPVKNPNNQIQWRSAAGSFAIFDRQDYGKLFSGKISMLDFSREDVHSTEPILLALGLGGRYLSRAVSESTQVQDGNLDSQLTNDLRRKAYAICR
jgi:hypothetical protein